MTYPDGQPLESLAQQQLSRMSLEQKLGQLFLISLNGTEIDREFLKIEAQYCFGNVFLFGQNLRSPDQVRRLTSGIQQAAVQTSGGVIAMIAVDEEGGSASQFPFSITRLPGNFTLGAARDPEGTCAIGQALGNDLSDLGFNMLLGPVLDLCRSHSERIIGVRAYGDDPALAASLGVAFAKGVEKGGCGCTFKHFPGYGDIAMMDDRPLNTSTLDQLLAVDAYPFIQAVSHGARSIMAGQITLPNLPSRQPLLPASLSKTVIHDLLRQRLGFGGVVIADGAVAPGISAAKGAALALKAGVDILSHESLSYSIAMYKALHAQVVRGKLSMEDLDRHVLRILRLKSQLSGIFAGRQTMFQPEKSSWLKKTLENSVTLLRDTNRLIPLKNPQARALIISPLLEKPGILDDNAKDIHTFGDHMALLFQESIVRRVSCSPTRQEAEEILAQAAQADVVIIGSEDACMHPGYMELINRLAASRPTIAVLLRSPFDASGICENAALVGVFTHTVDAMEAVSLVLGGQLPPRGRLPLS